MKKNILSKLGLFIVVLLIVPIFLCSCFSWIAADTPIPITERFGDNAFSLDKSIVHFNLIGNSFSGIKDYAEKAKEMMDLYLINNPLYKDYCILFFQKGTSGCDFYAKVFEEVKNETDRAKFLDDFRKSYLRANPKYLLTEKIMKITKPLTKEELNQSGLLDNFNDFTNSHDSEITISTDAIHGYYEYEAIPYYMIFHTEIKYSVTKNSNQTYTIKLLSLAGSMDNYFNTFSDSSKLITY